MLGDFENSELLRRCVVYCSELENHAQDIEDQHEGAESLEDHA